jgi:hypothetical protein
MNKFLQHVKRDGAHFKSAVCSSITASFFFHEPRLIVSMIIFPILCLGMDYQDFKEGERLAKRKEAKIQQLDRIEKESRRQRMVNW